ncbi:helix-turn-helix domain-containing protein [Streptomyces sp. NPDC057027]|uniref:helix-turn-helix domain-containing protein n=1 Tax=Streptomyces sp. NPDC057027 TaxID=3346004 RepID=UPI003641C2FD
MRYPQGGGLTAERQAFRERIRMEAAVMFAAGRGSTDIAKELRVSVRSVQRWRQAWKAAGPNGVRSRGPVSKPKLSEALSLFHPLLEGVCARREHFDGAARQASFVQTRNFYMQGACLQLTVPRTASRK